MLVWFEVLEHLVTNSGSVMSPAAANCPTATAPANAYGLSCTGLTVSSYRVWVIDSRQSRRNASGSTSSEPGKKIPANAAREEAAKPR